MEGPSIHYLARELQLLVHQKVKKVSGNAQFDKEQLVGQTIQEIYAFGKRIFIQLDEHILITHFLMYGSYRIDEARAGFTPRLVVATNKHTLYLYNCSVKCFAAKNVRQALPDEFDILSPTWNVQKVVRAIQKHPKETIDDILLNQRIFAGVGNIIKNEALFLARLSPLRKVARISAKKLKELAEHTRAFSLKFLEYQQKWDLFRTIRQIYRASVCPVCGTKVIRKKTGRTNRWSIYCPRCQK